MRAFLGEFACVGTCVCARLPTVRRFEEEAWSCLAAGAKTLIIHIKVYDQLGSDRSKTSCSRWCLRANDFSNTYTGVT